MATKTTTIKFVGQFDSSGITKGLQDIRKQMSNTHIGDDLRKQLETALSKVEAKIPELEKFAGKGEFNQKELLAYQKLIQEISKDMAALNKVTSEVDFTKNFSAADTAKLKEFDKQLQDVENKLKTTRKDILNNFAKSDKSKINGKNSVTLNGFIEQLISVPPDQIETKLNEIIKEVEDQAGNTVEKLKQDFATKANKNKINKEDFLNLLFGENSGVTLKKGKVLDTDKDTGRIGARNVYNQIREEILALKEDASSADIDEILKKYQKFIETYFNVPEGKQSVLANIITPEIIKHLQDLSKNIPELRQALGEEGLKLLAEGEGEKVRITAEQTAYMKQVVDELVASGKITKDQAEEVMQTLGLLNKQLDGAIDKTNQEKAQADALSATFGGLVHRIENSVSALAVFNKSMQIIRQAIRSVEDLDAAFTQIAIVSEQSGEAAWKMFDSFNSLAKQYSITTKDLTEGAKLFYQQGLSAADTMKMVEASTVSAALGEVTMTEAANTLTAAIQGYNESAAVAMDYTDKIAMVGAVSAADFNELSAAMEKTASSAYTAGIDFDHLLGYLGKMIEVTREAPANLGTAMKTIIARFEDMKKDPMAILEDGVSANKVEAALATIGIALRDSEGEFRALQDVFDELGMKWQSLTRNQQAYIATVAAGSRQQSRFLAMMNNYDRTLDLITESQNSAGAAAEQYATYQDSIAAAQARLTTSWEKFYSKIVDNGVIKLAINSLSSLIDVLSKVPPSLTAISAAFGALQLQNVFKLLRSNEGGIVRAVSGFKDLYEASKSNVGSFKELVEISPKLSNGLGIIKTATNNVKDNFIGTVKAISAFVVANGKWLLIAAGVAAAISAITYVLNAQKRAYEGTIDKIKEYQEESNNLNKHANDGERLIKKYEELTSKISLTDEEQQELNNTISEIAEIYDEAITYVDQYGNKQLANGEIIKNNIRLEKQLAKEKQRAALIEREELLNKNEDEWKPEDFTKINFSNPLITSYFSNKNQAQRLKGTQSLIDERFWKMFDSIGNSIAYDNITGLRNAAAELNSYIDRFGLSIEKLEGEFTHKDLFNFKDNVKNEIKNLEESLPELIKEVEDLQNDALKNLKKENFLSRAFLDINYNEFSTDISTAQNIIANEIESMFQRMDLNAWNNFLSNNNINIEKPEELTAKIQEILDSVTDDNYINLSNAFKDLNRGNIGLEDFITIFENSGNEAAIQFAKSFGETLRKQFEKEQDKYREYLNNIGITQENIDKAVAGEANIGDYEKRRQYIENYFKDSSGYMQSIINEFSDVSIEATNSLEKQIAEAIEEGSTGKLEEILNNWLNEFELIDNNAAEILLNGKLKEAIQQLASSATEEANKIADSLFSKKDYSSIKASELYQYRDMLGDSFYSSFKLGTDGNLSFNAEAQDKIKKASRQEEINSLEDEINKMEAMRNINQQMIDDNGDNNGELQKQIDSLEEQIRYYKTILDLASKLPDLLEDSMDITEDLELATRRYSKELEGFGHDVSANSRTLKSSADIADEYKKVLNITKTLDQQMKDIGHVSHETMTQLLEMGGLFSDFFTINDDKTIEYGLQNVTTQYQTASEAILDIQKKRQEAELELQRQEIDAEITLNNAKIQGYKDIAKALRDYAEYRRTEEKNSTDEQKRLRKEEVETQINAAQKSIQNAENVWTAQVAAAKMAYDQMADLDLAFWEHLNEKDIKTYIASTFESFTAIKAPEVGVIDLNDLIVNGSPEELDEAADKYEAAAEGLEAYNASLEKAKANLKAIDPTIYDEQAEKLNAMGKEGKEALDAIGKAAEELAKALEDLDNLLLEINRDLKSITVDYNPFTDLFEAWEKEWDYYYNIKRLIAEIGTQGQFIDNIISSDYASAEQKIAAEQAKIGNLLASMSANDAYIEALRAGMSQTAVELAAQYGEYYRIDPKTGQVYQHDTSLNDINGLINERREEIYELQKLQNEKENDLTLEEAKLDALEKEKSAYEDILSTIESQIDSLKDSEDITVDISSLQGEQTTLKAKVTAADNSIDSINSSIRAMEDEIQNIEVQITLKEDAFSKLEDYVSDMEDKVSEYEEYWENLNATIAEQQEILQSLTEEYQKYVDTAISTEQELYDAIVENYQDEINEKKKQYDYLKQLDNDYLQSIKDNISEQRKARDDANKKKSYQQSLQRAQLLQMDTSGAFRNELAELNKEIESQREDLYDDLVDKQVEALEKEIEKRHELYDKELAALDERLAYMQENAMLLWESVNAIVAEGAEAMMATLENTTSYINSSELSRMNQRKTWEYNIKKTFEGVENGVINTLNSLIQAGNDFIIDKYPEVGNAIDQYQEVFDETTLTLRAYNEAIAAYNLAIEEGKTELEAYNAALEAAGKVLNTSAIEAGIKLGLTFDNIKDSITTAGHNLDTLGNNIIEGNKSLFSNGAVVFQGVLDSFMATWNTRTYEFTGYAQNWVDTTNALKQQTDRNLEALSALTEVLLGHNDEISEAEQQLIAQILGIDTTMTDWKQQLMKMIGTFDEATGKFNNTIGSIENFDDQLQQTSREMYDDFIEERNRYRDELESLIDSIRVEIEAAIKDAGNAIRRAAEDINAGGSSNDDTGNTGKNTGGGKTGNTDTGGAGSSESQTQYFWYGIDTEGEKGVGGPFNSVSEAEDDLNKWRKSWKRIGSGIVKSLAEAQAYAGMSAFAKGGLANFTGPAWLDGTSSNPERVLSPKQTKLFESMVSSLERTANNSNINSALGSSYNIGDINTTIQVERLDNDTDIDKVARQVENRIMKSIRNRVTVSVA